MITKIDFNEFVKNNSENLSHKLYKIIIDEMELQNKDKERDIWMNRLEALAALPGWDFNKTIDEQPVDAFEIFGYESMHLTKILHTIFK